jgi:hypothetical protein
VEQTVGGILETYAARGVFKGFSRTGAGAFKMLWHRDRYFDLLLSGSNKLSFPVVLPGVPAKSKMMAEYRAFVAAFADPALVEHKRIDPGKASLKVSARQGGAGLEAAVIDGDWDYAVRKLIHAVHETYLVFLYDGAYYDYLIETFDLDPDRMA